jgi:hypothetical protein
MLVIGQSKCRSKSEPIGIWLYEKTVWVQKQHFAIAAMTTLQRQQSQ